MHVCVCVCVCVCVYVCVSFPVMMCRSLSGDDFLCFFVSSLVVCLYSSVDGLLGKLWRNAVETTLTCLCRGEIGGGKEGEGREGKRKTEREAGIMVFWARRVLRGDWEGNVAVIW